MYTGGNLMKMASHGCLCRNDNIRPKEKVHQVSNFNKRNKKFYGNGCLNNVEHVPVIADNRF